PRARSAESCPYLRAAWGWATNRVAAGRGRRRSGSNARASSRDRGVRRRVTRRAAIFLEMAVVACRLPECRRASAIDAHLSSAAGFALKVQKQAGTLRYGA